MTHDRLVTRDTKLEAPDGHKVVVVFGTMVVPKHAPLGANTVVRINNLRIGTDVVQQLPKKYAMWEPGDLCEELFGLESMRDASDESVVDRALKLIAQGNGGSTEMQSVVKKLKPMVDNLPEHDTGRSVIKSIITVHEEMFAKSSVSKTTAVAQTKRKKP